MKPLRILEPQVVSTPSVTKMSLRAIGTPSNLLEAGLERRRSSEARAAASAAFASSLRNALTFGSSCSERCRQARVTSSEDTFLAASCSDSSSIERSVSSAALIRECWARRSWCPPWRGRWPGPWPDRGKVARHLRATAHRRPWHGRSARCSRCSRTSAARSHQGLRRADLGTALPPPASARAGRGRPHGELLRPSASCRLLQSRRSLENIEHGSHHRPTFVRGASHQLLEPTLIQPDPLAMEAHVDIDRSLLERVQIHSTSGTLHEMNSPKLVLLRRGEGFGLLKRQPMLLFDLLSREILLFQIGRLLELVSHRSLLSQSLKGQFGSVRLGPIGEDFQILPIVIRRLVLFPLR